MRLKTTDAFAATEPSSINPSLMVVDQNVDRMSMDPDETGSIGTRSITFEFSALNNGIHSLGTFF